MSQRNLILAFLVVLFAATSGHVSDSAASQWEALAGAGKAGHQGDGLRANVAQLNRPSGVYVSAFGHILIADTGNSAIRRIDPNGMIWTIASSTSTSALPGRPALQAPEAVTESPSGDIFIADAGNHVIQRLRGSNLEVFAGTGDPLGALADGGTATRASLAFPRDVEYTGQGILIADQGHQRIRLVDGTGNITTVGGDGTRGSKGDGGPARDASLNLPAGIASGDDGSVLVADAGNNSIRKISSDGRIESIAKSVSGLRGISSNGQSTVISARDGVFKMGIDGSVETYPSIGARCSGDVAIGTNGMPMIACPDQHRIFALAQQNEASEMKIRIVRTARQIVRRRQIAFESTTAGKVHIELARGRRIMGRKVAVVRVGANSTSLNRRFFKSASPVTLRFRNIETGRVLSRIKLRPIRTDK